MRFTSAALSVVLPVGLLVAPVAAAPQPSPKPIAPRTQAIGLDGLGTSTVEAFSVRSSEQRRTLAATSALATEPFTMLAVTWAPDPAVGEMEVSVRTRTAGAWTSWTTIDFDPDSDADGQAPREGTRDGTEPLWADLSDGAQVRVDVLTGAAPKDLELVLIDSGRSEADAVVADPAGRGPLGGSVANAAVQRPPVRTRAQWGADESLRTSPASFSSTLQAVTIHHTASTNAYEPEDVPGILRAFYAYHVQSRGWSDIGYNVLVDRFGTAWEGRAGGLDRPVVGAHAGGFNTDTTGIAMIGTYDTAQPSEAMLETAARLTAWKLGQYERDPRGEVTLASRGSTRYAAGEQVRLARVFVHRDVSTTACPGEQLRAAMPALRTRAAEILDGASSTSPQAPPSEPAPEPPFGDIEAVTADASAPKVRVSGWAIDPDAGTHTTVRVTADGQSVGEALADRDRPDIAERYPQYSPRHGFDGVFDVPAGRRTVCVTALDQGGDADELLGCADVVVASGDPVGSVESARPASEVVGVRISGWALDPDVATSTEVRITVDGVAVRTLVAELPRADVAAAYPGSNDSRGFDAIVSAAPGVRDICAIAVNQGAGENVTLGCAPVDVPLRPAPADPPGARLVDASCPASVPDAQFRDVSSSVHRSAIACAAWWGLTAGVGDDRYAPEDRLSRGQLASFLARLLTAAGTTLPAAPADAYDDDDASPHERAINQMAAVGVVLGKGDRRYEPNGVVTRDQMASYLIRTYATHVGAPLPDGGDWYADVADSVHQRSVGTAARAGFSAGLAPGRYGPYEPTNRGQVASFLVRVLDMLIEHGRMPAKK